MRFTRATWPEGFFVLSNFIQRMFGEDSMVELHRRHAKISLAAIRPVSRAPISTISTTATVSNGVCQNGGVCHEVR